MASPTEPMPQHRQLPGRFARTPPIARAETQRSMAYIFRPTSAILYTECFGHLEAGVLPLFFDLADRVFSSEAHCYQFHDLEDQVGYDTDVRLELTRWATTHHKQIPEAHFLIKSKIVAMGVSTANLVLMRVGIRLVLHPDRQSFERAFLETAERTKSSL